MFGVYSLCAMVFSNFPQITKARLLIYWLSCRSRQCTVLAEDFDCGKDPRQSITESFMYHHQTFVDALWGDCVAFDWELYAYDIL